MTSRPTCSPPSARDLPGSWSKPASTCPPPTTTPAAPPTTSLTPSPACPPSSSTFGDPPRRQQATDQPHHADLAEERVAGDVENARAAPSQGSRAAQRASTTPMKE